MTKRPGGGLDTGNLMGFGVPTQHGVGAALAEEFLFRKETLVGENGIER